MPSEARASVSRRAMLRMAGVLAAGASLATVSAVHAEMLPDETLYANQLQDAQDSPQTILNLAATAEALAITHYYNAIVNGSLGLDDEEMDYLKAALAEEIAHLQFLQANGGMMLADQFFVPANVFDDRAIFVQTTDTAELAFTAAYLAATRRFAELGNPRLAVVAAQVAAVEQTHKALIRDIGGLLPNNVTLAQPIFYNVSDALPVLRPFLNGGEGFVGPAPFPGIDEAMQAAQGVDIVSVPPFTQLF